MNIHSPVFLHNRGNWMTYEKTQDGFNKDTDELLNKICVTFHDELKVLADKYGTITVLLKTVED
jgi:hypothetical protein